MEGALIMDTIVKKLSEIEHAAEAVVSHAEEQKAELEKEIQAERDAYDEELERKTQGQLQAIRSGLERQMEEVLKKQEEKNQSAIEQIRRDFEEKHTIYATEIVKHIIEG